MKPDWKSRWGGVVAGLFSALNVSIGKHVLFGPPMGPDRILMILAETALVVGPGLLIINWAFCVTFRRRMERGGSRGSTLILGLLLGPLLGVLNLAIFFLCFAGPRALHNLLSVGSATSLYVLLVGVSSGAGAGLVSAWMVSRPAPE